MAGARVTFRSAIRPQQDTESSRYPLVDGSASGIGRGKPRSILRTGGAIQQAWMQLDASTQTAASAANWFEISDLRFQSYGEHFFPPRGL
jgi:hypothetical protein